MQIEKQPAKASSLIEVQDIIRSARDIFERLLVDALGTRATGGSCLLASVMLCEMLDHFSSVKTIIRGGGPPDDGGVMDAHGVIRGHYWVELELGDQAFVADITADQFGHAPVVVLPLPAARVQYMPGNQANVDEAVLFERETLRAFQAPIAEAGEQSTPTAHRSSS